MLTHVAYSLWAESKVREKGINFEGLERAKNEIYYGNECYIWIHNDILVIE